MKKLKYLFSVMLLFSAITASPQNNDMTNDWANLNKYKHENAASIPNTANVVFMGDSITEFWQTNDPVFFASNSFINRGISGQTTPQMLLRFPQDVVNLRPAKVVILAGINDIAENTGPISVDGIMKNIAAMAELAQSNSIIPVLCSVLPANHFYWNPKLNPADKVILLNQMIKEYATLHHLNYIDYYSVMVDEAKGLQKQFGDDGVHPNLAGYKIMEDLLLKKL